MKLRGISVIPLKLVLSHRWITPIYLERNLGKSAFQEHFFVVFALHAAFSLLREEAAAILSGHAKATWGV